MCSFSALAFDATPACTVVITYWAIAPLFSPLSFSAFIMLWLMNLSKLVFSKPLKSSGLAINLFSASIKAWRVVFISFKALISLLMASTVAWLALPFINSVSSVLAAAKASATVLSPAASLPSNSLILASKSVAVTLPSTRSCKSLTFFSKAFVAASTAAFMSSVLTGLVDLILSTCSCKPLMSSS